MTYHGGFYFEKIDDGTLSGEYLEHRNTIPQRETCTRIRNPNSPPSDDPWVGTYDTTWEQPDGNTHTATLTIQRDGLIYRLAWTRLQNVNGSQSRLNYRGEAMLVNGMLVGGYRSV